MAQLTLTQLAQVEQNATYKTKLRVAALNVAAFQKSASPAATEAWFRNRQTAETLLASPQVSVDTAYWAAKSMAQLKNEDVSGIDANSDAETIALAITDARYASMAETIYAIETKKVLF